MDEALLRINLTHVRHRLDGLVELGARAEYQIRIVAFVYRYAAPLTQEIAIALQLAFTKGLLSLFPEVTPAGSDAQERPLPVPLFGCVQRLDAPHKVSAVVAVAVNLLP